MPDAHKSPEQPQHGHVKRTDDVREQARRLHGKRYPIAPGKTDDDGGEHRTNSRHGSVVTNSDRPTRKPPLSSSGKNERNPERTKYEPSTALLSNRNRPLASVSPMPADPIFYPVYCHKASPTYFQWAKLTAHSIQHTLRHHEGYLHSWITQQIHSHSRNAPQLLFYNNHPIQFVQVVGVVVSVEEYFESCWLFTLDDSSGVTIDVVCQKPKKDRYKRPDALEENEFGEDETEDAMEIQKLSDQVAAVVDVGAILQVKGTITLYQRNRSVEYSANILGYPNIAKQYPAPKQEMPTRQICLQRLSVVHDTNKEISLVAARAAFYENVLNRPWSLTKQEQAKLHRRALGEVEHKRQKLRKAESEETRDAEDILRRYAEDEQGRMQEAARARAAGEALKISKVQHKVSTKNIQRPVTTATTATEFTDLPLEGNEITKANRGEKRKKRRSVIEAPGAQNGTSASCSEPHRSKPDTSLSFAADDDEKSALLRAAFG